MFKKLMITLTLLASCASNEEIFLNEASETSCKCYDDDHTSATGLYAACVEVAKESYENTLEFTECSGGLYNRDSQFVLENKSISDCLVTLRKDAANELGTCNYTKNKGDVPRSTDFHLREWCPNVCKYRSH
jgi:hypothetical protein